MPTPFPSVPNSPAYYAEVARRFDEVACYVRSHPELNSNIADHLNGLASDILKDARPEPSSLASSAPQIATAVTS